MGLATIDTHNQKDHTEIHKIPNFGVNQASFDWDNAIQKRQNLQRNVRPSGKTSSRSVEIRSADWPEKYAQKRALHPLK